MNINGVSFLLFVFRNILRSRTAHLTPNVSIEVVPDDDGGPRRELGIDRLRTGGSALSLLEPSKTGSSTSLNVQAKQNIFKFMNKFKILTKKTKPDQKKDDSNRKSSFQLAPRKTLDVEASSTSKSQSSLFPSKLFQRQASFFKKNSAEDEQKQKPSSHKLD